MISSRIKVQYWMNDKMISPSDNPWLYPNGSELVSQVHIFDADWTDALLDNFGSAWNFANGVLRAAEGNLLSAGFSAADFGRSITKLKNELSEKVGMNATTLAIAFPNELFNNIHVVFEADAEVDLKRPVAAPPSNPPLVQYNGSESVGKHQQAEYIIDLHQLQAHMGEDKFYGSTGPRHPHPGITFAFANEEADETAGLSVL